MANSYSYSIFLKDFMSSKVMKVGTTVGSVYSKITQTQDKFQNKTFQNAKSIDGLREKLEKLGTQKGAATTVREVRKINGEIQRTEKSLKKLDNLPPQNMISRLSGVGGIMKGWVGAAAGAFGAMSLFNGVKGIAQLGMDAEQTRVKFSTLLGGVGKANTMIAMLNKFANATPFENADLQKNAELLLNFGIAGNKIVPTLKMLGDISGGNKEKLSSLSLAYAQAQSTGKLMGQDLLQMINAGFNPLEVISRKTGKSIGVLKEEMSKGKISAADLEDAFKTATSKGGRFSGMMEKISKTGIGKMSTFIGNLKTNLAGFSEKYLVPVINKGVDFGIKLVNGFDVVRNSVVNLFSKLNPLWNSVTGLISGIIGINTETNGASAALNSFAWITDSLSIVLEIASNGIATILNWITPLAPVLKYVILGFGLWKMVILAVNVAMYANPVSLIIAGIVGLIGVIVYAYNKVGWFRGGIMAAWETLKAFGTIIKEYVTNRIKDLVSGIAGMGESMMLFFKGDWKKAWEAGKKATSDLLGVDSNTNAIKKVLELGKTAGTAYSKGVAEANKNKGMGFSSKIANKLGLGNFDSLSNGADTTLDSLANSDSINKGIDGINGGGSKQTNINVTYGTLIKELVLQSQTLTEGLDEIEDKVKVILMRILNSSNQMQTSNG